MSGFTKYQPTGMEAGRKAGPPIIKVTRNERGTWLYFSAVIRRTLDVISKGQYLSDKMSFITVSVDLGNNLLAIQNCKEDDPGALRVTGVASTSQPYVFAGDLGDLYNIPAGRYEAKQQMIDGGYTKAWVIDWTKDLGPGKYYPPRRARTEDDE